MHEVILDIALVMMIILLVGTSPVAVGLAVEPLSFVVIKCGVDDSADAFHLVIDPFALIYGAVVPHDQAAFLPHLYVTFFDYLADVAALLILDWSH